MPMKGPQISLATSLLLIGALPIWMLLIVVVPASTGWGGGSFRFVAAPLTLIAMTAAIHILFRRWKDGWAASMLLAAVVALGSLSVAAWISS